MGSAAGRARKFFEFPRIGARGAGAHAEAELLLGRGGDDRLDGAGGDDVLHGDEGDDELTGGAGLAGAFGGAGDDGIAIRDGERDRYGCAGGVDRVVADGADAADDGPDCETVESQP